MFSCQPSLIILPLFKLPLSLANIFLQEINTNYCQRGAEDNNFQAQALKLENFKWSETRPHSKYTFP